MMVMEERVMSQLRLVFNNGFDSETGKTIYKTKSFQNVKTNANAEQLFNTATAIASLQTLELEAMERQDKAVISKAQ